MNEQEILELVKHWCPKNLQHEPFGNQVLRALMCANACALDLQRKLDGKNLIRSLDSYPERKV